MNKVAFFTDCHFGVRGSNPHFDDYIMKFFENQFFPECKKKMVTDVFCLGDFTDNRKQINFRTLDVIKNKFLPLLVEYNITLHIFDGNHDIFYKHSNEISSMMLIEDHPNVIVYKEPTEVVVGDTKFLLVPWLNENNFEEFYGTIKESDAEVCLGHFEFEGAKMFSSSTAISGLSPTLFKHFKKVLVGHFHHRNKLSNIQYIGATGYYTWQDYNDYRGGMFLDTTSLEESYIENKYSLFEEVIYEDNLFDELIEKLPSLTDKVVKLIVKSKDNLVNFESYKRELYKISTINFTIIDESVIVFKNNSTEQKSETSVNTPIVDMIKVELETEEEFAEIEIIYSAAMLTEDI